MKEAMPGLLCHLSEQGERTTTNLCWRHQLSRYLKPELLGVPLLLPARLVPQMVHLACEGLYDLAPPSFSYADSHIHSHT